MSNILKRAGAIVLALCLMVCMLPLTAVNAEETSLTQDVTVYINDVLVGTVDAAWIDANSTDTYTYAQLQYSKKGQKLTYVKATGVDFEKLLIQAGAIESDLYTELAGAQIRFGEAAAANTSKFDLVVNADMKNATSAYGPTEGSKVSNDQSKPIIATKIYDPGTNVYGGTDEAATTAYAEAAAGTPAACANLFLIGQSTNSYGASDYGHPCINAKYAIKPTVSVNIYLAPEQVSVDTSKALKVGENATLTASVEKSAYADYFNAVWSSSDDTVATVDQNGKVTAVGEGTCEITLSVNGKSVAAQASASADTEAISAVCAVTVTKAAAPVDPDAGDDNKPGAVDTSDTQNVFVYAIMMILSIAGLAGLALKRR